MTERINGNGFRPVDTGTTRRTETAKTADGDAGDGAAAASAPASGDTVNFTRSGLLMSKLEDLVQNLPVVDAGRVRTIKDALASGTYVIDDQRVADKMIRFDRELLA